MFVAFVVSSGAIGSATSYLAVTIVKSTCLKGLFSPLFQLASAAKPLVVPLPLTLSAGAAFICAFCAFPQVVSKLYLPDIKQLRVFFSTLKEKKLCKQANNQALEGELKGGYLAV